MNGRVIRIPRDLYESLPQIYQVIAQIGEQSGQVLIVERKAGIKTKENRNWKCDNGCYSREFSE